MNIVTSTSLLVLALLAFAAFHVGAAVVVLSYALITLTLVTVRAAAVPFARWRAYRGMGSVPTRG